MTPAEPVNVMKTLGLDDSDEDADAKQSTKRCHKSKERRPPNDKTTVLQFQWGGSDIEGLLDHKKIKIKVTVTSINALVDYVRQMVKKLEACVFCVNEMGCRSLPCSS